jgi:hypothetical protein
VRVGLVVLLVVLAAAPLAYQYLASMLTVPALDFASTSNSAPSSELILTYGGLASQLVQEGNYTEAERLLEMAGGLPADTDSNLKTYITLMNELTLTLDSVKSKLDNLQELTSDGALAQAREEIPGIESLMADGSRRLALLYSALDRIGTMYPVDISTQKRHLDTFSSTLLSFEQLLRSLETQVEAMDGRIVTRLDLTAGPSPVQIEEYLQISGLLQGGAMNVGGRTVELWVNEVKIANLTLNGLGIFHWQYLVSNQTRNDRLEIYARYSPVGDDISRFRPARSNIVTVPVHYRPVVLTIVSLSKRVLVLENFTVQGRLAESPGQALPAESVDLLVDGKLVNSSMTDSAGMYSINASFPAGALEGDHQLYTRFEPKDGVYASAVSNETAIQLYYLRPAIGDLSLSGVAIVNGESVAISGQTAQMEGRLEIDSKPLSQGLLIAYLAGREVGRALSRANGVFRITITIPYDASDVDKIEVVFAPADPSMALGTASLVVRVLNSIVFSLAVGAGIFSVLVFSERSIDPRFILLRRAGSRRRAGTETVVVETPAVEERAVAAPSLSSLSDFKLELELQLKFDDPRAFVKIAYQETTRMLSQVLGVRGDPSETPREYAVRVLDRLGVAASSLSAITQLFELAEYSQHAISRSEAEEGRNHAFRVAEELNTRVKH